jgi:metal-responsive CopG/Arc/MetJ family transcriptional regulator
MKSISRNTQVISISLPKNLARKLDQDRARRGQSRSAYVASLVDRAAEDARWERIYKWGRETTRKLKITSEDDIDRILHEN